MNQSITGWQYFKNPRNFAGYGRQQGWECITPTTKTGKTSKETLNDKVKKLMRQDVKNGNF